jgi:hypothetical protein
MVLLSGEIAGYLIHKGFSWEKRGETRSIKSVNVRNFFILQGIDYWFID